MLEEPLPTVPTQGAVRVVVEAYRKHKEDSLDVQCIMLSSMSNELQKLYEDKDPRDILSSLQGLYEERARQECFEVSRALFTCKMGEGAQAGMHVVRMITYIEQLQL